MIMLVRNVVFVFLSTPFLACSGSTPNIGPADSDVPSADASDAGAIIGPKVTIRIKTTTAPFAHADGLSGQTTRATKEGVRRFRLLRAADDPSPVVVFDHGNDFVEAGFAERGDTVVGVAPVAKVLPG